MLCQVVLAFCLNFVQPTNVKVGNIFADDIDPDAVKISLELTAKEIQETIDPNLHFQFHSYPSHCDVHKAVEIIHEFRHTDINAVVGPLCPEEMGAVGIFAAVWDMAILGYAHPDVALANKRVYSTLTRVSYTSEEFARASMVVIRAFGWKKVGLIIDHDFPCDVYSDTLQEMALRESLEVFQVQIDDGNHDHEGVDDTNDYEDDDHDHNYEETDYTDHGDDNTDHIDQERDHNANVVEDPLIKLLGQKDKDADNEINHNYNDTDSSINDHDDKNHNSQDDDNHIDHDDDNHIGEDIHDHEYGESSKNDHDYDGKGKARLQGKDLPSTEDIENVISRLKNQTRTIFACMGSGLAGLRRYLLKAHQHNMTGPDYTHILVYRDKIFDKKPWEYNDGQDELSKELFMQSLVLLPEGYYTNNSMNWANKIEKMTIARHNKTIETFKHQAVHLAMIHDSLKGYALSVHNCQKRNKTCHWKSGKDVLRLTKNIQFDGITGRVMMSKTGDRISDFYLASPAAVDGWKGHYKIHVTMEGSSQTRVLQTVVVSIIYHSTQFYIQNVLSEVPFNWRTENNKPPPSYPVCGFLGEHCAAPNEKSYLFQIISAIIVFCFMSIILLAAMMWRRNKKIEHDLFYAWVINGKNLKDVVDIGKDKNVSLRSFQRLADKVDHDDMFTKRATYFDMPVLIECYQTTVQLNFGGSKKGNLALIREMKQLKVDNVNPFIGMCIKKKGLDIVWSFPQKGSLEEIIFNDEIRLDMHFKVSIVRDLIKGLEYIHHSKVGCHGMLVLKNCHVNSRWMVQLTNFGITQLLLQSFQKNQIVMTGRYNEDDYLQAAPEVLRTFSTDFGPSEMPTQAADIYGLAMVIYQVFFREKPFTNNNQMTKKEILDQLMTPVNMLIRPLFPEGKKDIHGDIISLLESCWKETPEERPKMNRIKNIIFAVTNNLYTGSLVDHMIITMEKYAENLEKMVLLRTIELEDERKRADALLNKMLPKAIADKLKQGVHVEPEMFQSVTLMFADIVGFTTICSTSNPEEVVTMMNLFYSAFDEISEKFDVYKVETIGDAYMVASGLPIRNGVKHVTEIADLALTYTESLKDFQIPHMPNHYFKVRVGIHSGPVAAGVVGLSMPHYCLFGDTVNMASRMESNGEALKIHVSLATKILLETFANYRLLRRGNMEIKGKGIQETFWLERGEIVQEENSGE